MVRTRNKTPSQASPKKREGSGRVTRTSSSAKSCKESESSDESDVETQPARLTRSSRSQPSPKNKNNSPAKKTVEESPSQKINHSEESVFSDDKKQMNGDAPSLKRSTRRSGSVVDSPTAEPVPIKKPKPSSDENSSPRTSNQNKHSEESSSSETNKQNESCGDRTIDSSSPQVVKGISKQDSPPIVNITLSDGDSGEETDIESIGDEDDEIMLQMDDEEEGSESDDLHFRLSDDDEDDDIEEIDSSDMSDGSDVVVLGHDEMDLSNPKAPAKLKAKLKDLQQRMAKTKVLVEKMHQVHREQLQIKDEEILRVRHDIKYKDEQLEEMNQLTTRNMELEAKISLVLSDKDAYHQEVENVEKEKKLREQKEQKKKVASQEKKLAPEVKKQAPEVKAEEATPETDDSSASASSEESEVEDLDDRGKEEKEEAEKEEDGDKKTPKRKKRKAADGEETEGEPQKKKKGRKKKEKPIQPLVDEIDKMFVDLDGDSDVEIIKEVKASEDKKKNDESQTEDKEVEKEDGDDEDGTNKGRHNIRKMMGSGKLQEKTIQAAKDEKERRERAKKEHDQHLVVMDKDSRTKQPICTKLVLAMKEGTKTPLVEVNQKVVRKLKPHQVEAVEFLWDNLVESMKKLKNKEEGSGCILAHCMGLGKTLSVIATVHTMLTTRACHLKRCMVVCPLNTVLNWQYEWDKWLLKKDRIDVYELASCKGNHERVEQLQEWKSTGGVMIIGYSLFRILANYSGRSKKTKKAFNENLVDPGPDIVVCDEGHVLKNDSSAISKCLNRTRTRRRIVLTGTPLQNNLIEYHCMVSFVKPKLLGTRKEFSNRFVNPITNGQHKDSTSYDVKLMKRRAHILHEMLDGCVQRRDYAALTKWLPSKNEYIISVRLSEIQVKLYELYLNHTRPDDRNTFCRGTGLFADYQALMRVWTHPWVLKLDEIRQEKKAFNEEMDDELDSILYTSSDEDDVIITDDSSVQEDKASSKTTDLSEQSAESEEEDVDSDGSSETEVLLSPRARRLRDRLRQDKALPVVDSDSESTSTLNSNAVRPATRNAANKQEKESSDKNAKGSKSPKRQKENGQSKEADSKEADQNGPPVRKAKVIAGEVIKEWKSKSRGIGKEETLDHKKEEQWWAKLVSDEDKEKVELSGKLILMFEILRMSEGLGDKLLIFSQSILTLDIIEDFLAVKTEQAEKKNAEKKRGPKMSLWNNAEDYCRMDGTTGPQTRKKMVTDFNNEKNKRMRLFLISTRAGGLGINLDGANRVIIFDASWNPSHDIQSIFRVYRFGQEKDVFVYRFLAQGTMEEKIYERQVTKETLSQRVVDEQQLDRHFSAHDLQELYIFKPDKLDDPDRPTPPTPAVPKDVILAELLSSQMDWIVGYHEHDSLLERRPEEDLTEDERKAAWDEYDKEKQGLTLYPRYQPNYMPRPYIPPPMPRLPYGMLSGFRNQMPVSAPTFGTASSALGGTGAAIAGSAYGPDGQRFNMQIAQLPRVVQEILKYNPTITADELQHRLQAFLGMHSRFVGLNQYEAIVDRDEDSKVKIQIRKKPNVVIPGAGGAPAVGDAGPLPVGDPLPVSAAPLAIPAEIPAQPSNSALLAAFSNMPSRLPPTGNVPALTKPN